MKIAMIGHKRIPSREGGIEIVVERLSQRLVNLGDSVVAFNRNSSHIAGDSFNTEHIYEYEGIKLIWVPTPESAKLNAIVYSFLSTLSAIFGNYDIIHYHAEGPAAMIPLAKLFGKKCVVTIHGLDWQRSKWGGFATKFLKFGEKCAAKYANEVIVLSENVQDYFQRNYSRNTTYIPNGCEKANIRSADIIKKKYSLEKDNYILYLGRIVPEKGIHYLIEAYKNVDTQKKLVIAGGASHTSEYESEVRALASDNKNIIFTGFIQGRELEELYSNAYVYCLPSDLEGMPISLLEAMSYSNCCLTSDICECTQVCGDNAVYFSRGNTDDLRQKLQFLCSNADEVKKYKKNSAKYVAQKYNWDDVAKKTREIYANIVNS